MRAIKYMVTLLGSVSLWTACTNGQTFEEDEGKVPLEIEVMNRNERAVLDGNTLPFQTSFGIYGVTEEGSALADRSVRNLPVFYDGICHPAEKVLLGEEKMALKAYYPYSEEVEEGILPIDIHDQTDILYGESVATEGGIGYVNKQSPKAHIAFSHLMSRLTLRVRHNEGYGADFMLMNISLFPSCQTAQWDVLSHVLTPGQTGLCTWPIEVMVTNEFTSVDLLVIPMEDGGTTPKSILLSGDSGEGQWIELPGGDWKSGQQYTYEVIFEDNKIRVNETDITPWEVITEPDQEITDTYWTNH